MLFHYGIRCNASSNRFGFQTEFIHLIGLIGFNLHELIDIPTSTPKSTVGSVLCKKCNVLGVEDGISMLRCEAAVGLFFILRAILIVFSELWCCVSQKVH